MKKAEKIIVICIVSVLVFICLFFVPKLSFFNYKKLGASVAYSGYEDKVIYFDLEAYTNSLPSSTEEYDYMKVAFALQGLINRNQPLLYYKYKENNFRFLDTNIDEVWLADLQSSDNMYQGKTVVTYTDFYQVIQLAKDLGVVNGAVLWDPKVPATSNVASTIAGVENLVPIRKDETNFSCYTDLVLNRGLFTVQRDLTDKFTGTGFLPDANLNAQSSGTASSGSKKNDAYLWAKKYYLDNKKVSTTVMGYTRDAWIKPCSTEACFVDSYVPENMAPGEERQVFITVLNNTSEEWSAANNYRIAAVKGGKNAFTVTDALYGFEQGDNPNEVRLYLDPNNNISPGERYRVSFTIKAPTTAGSYHLNLGFVKDGYRWYSGAIDLNINVGTSTGNKKTEHYGNYPQGIFHAGLNTSDYLIANKAFFFDLSPDNTIAPIDDRSQPVGTDVATLRQLLAQERTNNNNGIFTVIGFVPWFIKYTSTSDSSSSLGDVAAEWKMVEYISSYNGQSDADAFAPVGLTNASAFMHQPLKAPFTQNNDKEAIKSDSVVKEKYDSSTTYFILLMGDYDCGAWTSGVLPSRFLLDWGTEDRYPLTWPIAADLSTRVPQAFNWIYSHQNRNDYFVAGDNGTGYLTPASSPDLTTWKNHNIEKLSQFDIDVTGFLIGGNNSINSTIQNAYVQMTPVLVGYQGTVASSKVGNTPFIPSANLPPDTAETSATTTGNRIYEQLAGTSSKFIIIRSIQLPRSKAYGAIDRVYELAAQNNKKVKLVDPYTMAQLYIDHPTSYKGCYTNGTNYQWVNGSTIPSGYKYVSTSDSSETCHKPRTKLTKPTISSSTYIYTGSEITPAITGYDSTTMNLTGDTSKTETGNYSITISLKNTTDYEWSDGSQSNVTFNWSIADERIELDYPLPVRNLKDLEFYNYDENILSMDVQYKVNSEHDYCIFVDFDIKDKSKYKWKEEITMMDVECWYSFEPCYQHAYPEIKDNKIFVEKNATISSIKKIYPNIKIYENNIEITDDTSILNSNQTAKMNNLEFEIVVTSDKIHFLSDYGKNGGDAIVIESNGHFGLIDAMNPGQTSVIDQSFNDNNDNGTKVRDYLTSIGCYDLDFIILTHSHSDHIGGIPELRDKVNSNTKVFYKEDITSLDDIEDDNCGSSSNCKHWHNHEYYNAAINYFNSVNAKLCSLENMPSDCEVTYDNNDSFTYDTNLKHNYSFNFENFNIKLYNIHNISYHFENLNSIATLVTHTPTGKKTALLGDQETARNDLDEYEKDGTDYNPQIHPNSTIENPVGTCSECKNRGLENQLSDIIGEVDILKANHHSSSTSNSYYMLNNFKPKNYIITSSQTIEDSKTYLRESSTASIFYMNKKYNTKSYYANQSAGALVAEFNNDINIYNYNQAGEKSGTISPATKAAKDGWYYMNDTTNKNKKWVYIENDSLKYGWLNYNENDYYLDDDGIMLTGINYLKYNNVNGYYYFNNEGKMQTKWKKVDNNWYYFRKERDEISSGYKGSAVTGWADIKDSDSDIYYKYYFRKNENDISSGPAASMVKGLVNIDDKTYYFREEKDISTDSPEGSMVKNACITINLEEYCFDNDGVLIENIDISKLNIKNNVVILNKNSNLDTIFDILEITATNKIKVYDGETELNHNTKLKTNNILRIKDSSYPIAILGDVKADGIVNGQDAGMAYIKTGTSVSDLTMAEKMALDYNMDGYYNMLDVWQIYNNNIN